MNCYCCWNCLTMKAYKFCRCCCSMSLNYYYLILVRKPALKCCQDCCFLNRCYNLKNCYSSLDLWQYWYCNRGSYSGLPYGACYLFLLPKCKLVPGNKMDYNSNRCDNYCNYNNSNCKGCYYNCNHQDPSTCGHVCSSV